MKGGWLSREFIIHLYNGEILKINTKRFLSLQHDEIGAIQYNVTPLSNNIKLELTPLTTVYKIRCYLTEQFWDHYLSSSNDENSAFVLSKTLNTNFHVCTYMSTNVYINNDLFKCIPSINSNNNLIEFSEFLLNKNDELTLFKVGGYVNSNDSEKESFNDIIKKECDNALKAGFIDLCKENIAEWNKIWECSDIVINGDVKSQQAIRFNIFQLNQTFNGNDPSLNIGPKGFTGEKYGGVTYWDTEAYCVPFYLGTKDTDVAKNLLNQRYNQLENAIKNAEKIGLNHGAALYPMVTVNGEECHNEWEITFEEIHRNAAIAQAIKKYITFTDDFEFLENKGIKILIAISRFWKQRVNFSSLLNKYVILGCYRP